MMGLDNVGTQLVQWKLCWIRAVVRRARVFYSQRGDNRICSDLLVFTGFAQRSAALTTEINGKGLKNTRPTGTLGDEFSHGAVQCGGSRGGVNVWCVTHTGMSQLKNPKQFKTKISFFSFCAKYKFWHAEPWRGQSLQSSSSSGEWAAISKPWSRCLRPQRPRMVAASISRICVMFSEKFALNNNQGWPSLLISG